MPNAFQNEVNFHIIEAKYILNKDEFQIIDAKCISIRDTFQIMGAKCISKRGQLSNYMCQMHFKQRQVSNYGCQKAFQNEVIFQIIGAKSISNKDADCDCWVDTLCGEFMGHTKEGRVLYMLELVLMDYREKTQWSHDPKWT